MTGAVWGYTSAEKLRVLKREDQLTTFTFNRHRGQHKFCKVCGIQPFAVGSIAVINVNCLEGIDPKRSTARARRRALCLTGASVTVNAVTRARAATPFQQAPAARSSSRY